MFSFAEQTTAQIVYNQPPEKVFIDIFSDRSGRFVFQPRLYPGGCRSVFAGLASRSQRICLFDAYGRCPVRSLFVLRHSEWMRRSAGAIATNRTVLPLILLGCTVSAFVMICLLFWSAAIGWFTFGGYGAENVHPFFELSGSPLWFVVSRLFIDWWSLCFLIFLGLAGVLIAKKELLALWLPLAWSSGLMLLFKFNISFKGLLPGEGMLLSIHAAGASPILAASVSEGAVFVLWLISYVATAKK